MMRTTLPCSLYMYPEDPDEQQPNLEGLEKFYQETNNVLSLDRQEFPQT